MTEYAIAKFNISINNKSFLKDHKYKIEQIFNQNKIYVTTEEAEQEEFSISDFEAMFNYYNS